MPTGRLLILLAVLLCAGCASLTVTDTKPLPRDKLEPPGSFAISHGGYRLNSLDAGPAAPDLLVLVAMSGGGKRSAAFGYGVLKGMKQVMVPTAFGPRRCWEVSAISGVSGGSFPAAYYGLYREAACKFEEDFL